MTTIATPAFLTADDFTAIAAALTFRPEPHTYQVGLTQMPSVTQILKAVGVSVDFERLVERGQLLAAVLNEKRAVGQGVHLATHYYDLGALDRSALDPRIEPYLQAWVDFREATGFVPTLLETPVHHPGLLIAGTLDRAGTFTKFEGCQPHDLHIVDIKCGDPEDAAARWQTVAYAEMLSLALRKDVFLRSGGEAAFRLRPRYSVRLDADGRWNLSTYKDYLNDWRDFKHFCTTFRCQVAQRRAQR